MSIYGPGWVCDTDDHADSCARWVWCECADPHGHWHGRIPAEGEGHWLYDPDVPCTCLCGPIVYRGGHVFPSNEDDRRGMIAFDEISTYLTRDGRDDGPDDGRVHPWVRVTVDVEDTQTLVLDRNAMEGLVAFGMSWLERSASTDRLSRGEQ